MIYFWEVGEINKAKHKFEKAIKLAKQQYLDNLNQQLFF